MRALRATAVVFGLAFALHVADHARRGVDASPTYVFVVGALQGVLVAAGLAWVWTGRRHAPLVAIVVGLVSAFLVTSGHLLPAPPGEPNDSYLSPPATNVTWLSWASAVAELAGALAVAGAGLLARGREGPRRN